VTDTPTRHTAAEPAAIRKPTAWAGWVIFGGMMMIILGALQAIDGLVALFRDNVYIVRPSGLAVEIDYTAWGWTHLLLGVLLIAAGVGVLSGQVWARTLGVIAAALSVLVNFAFMPAYPFWSLTIITVDVLVIYALIAHGGELRKDRYV
jgi:hypothetical protein